MPPEKVFRKFGNQRYMVASNYPSKARADSMARHARENGKLARVVKSSRKGKPIYYLYVRGKGKTWSKK